MGNLFNVKTFTLKYFFYLFILSYSWLNFPAIICNVCIVFECEFSQKIKGEVS